MATLSPSSWNTPAGYDGWYYVITLSVASTSGSTVKVNYRVNAGPRPSGADMWYRTSALTFSVNGKQIDSKATEYVETDTAGRLMMSGSFSVTGTSFTVSFTGDFWYNAGTGCNDTQTVQVKGLTYTVTFDLAGGTRTGGGALTQTVVAGGNATPPTCSRSGYTFAGWNGSYTNVTSNRTITAKWTANTYTITYNANGGTGAPSSQTKTYGQPLTLSSTKPTASWTLTYNSNGGTVSPTSKSVSRPFKAWNTRADGTGTSYASGASYTANASVTLYAQYTNPTAGTLPTPTRSNCTFNRWTTAQNSGSTVTSSTTITKNTTIYAFWNYKLTLDGNGGTIQIYDPHQETVTWEDESGQHTEIVTVDYRDVQTTSIYVPHGEPFNLSNYSNVTYITTDSDETMSKEFEGWSTSASSNIINYTPTSSITLTDPEVLYAVFSTLTFTVTFEDGFGNVMKTQSGIPYGGNATPPTQSVIDQYTRPGYTFTGWLGIYQGVRQNTTVIALWGFTPVWIYQYPSGESTPKWIAYEPKEN